MEIQDNEGSLTEEDCGRVHYKKIMKWDDNSFEFML